MSEKIPAVLQLLGPDDTPIFTNFGTIADIIRRRHQAGKGAPLCDGKMSNVEGGQICVCGYSASHYGISMFGTAHAKRRTD